MDFPTYRRQNLIPIELPSGLTGTMRKPSIIDLAEHPDIRAKIDDDEDMTPRTIAITRLCFLDLIELDQGKAVDKPPRECNESELSIREFTQEDIHFVLRKFTGFFLDAGEDAGGDGGGETKED